ncbi:MAG: [FeFe] hydrogenase H-cluster maturation GTPase HydF, partial [Endomicrobiales bacterium]
MKKTTTPKSLRLHIGIFGRANAGKSSVLNLIAGQDVAITSPVPGTTTDVVEKTMELLPLGPVVFLDTAGLGDVSALSEKRLKKTAKVFDVSDVMLLVIEPGAWGPYEEEILAQARKRNTPLIAVVNKIDVKAPAEGFLRALREKTGRYLLVSSLDAGSRDAFVNALKQELIAAAPDDFLNPPPLIGDLIPAGGMAALVVPIDLEAPKGRLILPQVQAIRDILDTDASALVVKEREYPSLLAMLKRHPDIAVCDSQVVLKMVADTPPEVKCTTFSILFSRQRGDLIEAAKGAAAIPRLKAGDRILIAEACSHHAVEDDIGRVKIPRWLKQYAGHEVLFDVASGSDYPENLKDYALVIHCGGCMINRRHMLSRIEQAREAGVPITNYGICISLVQGVLERVLAPFPAALDAYKTALKRREPRRKQGPPSFS